MTQKMKHSTHETTSTPLDGGSGLHWKKPQDYFAHMKKMLHHAKGTKPLLDPKKLLEHHRNQAGSLSEMNKIATNMFKSIAKMQGHYVKQALQDFNQFLRGVIKSKGIPDLQEHHAHLQGSIKKAMAHSSSVRQVMIEAHREAAHKAHARMQEGTDALKKSTGHSRH
jgi:hypothetical protein